MPEPFEIVPLPGGDPTLRSLEYDELYHPVIGPVAEANALYVTQLDLVRRLQEQGDDDFVVWDVGLGAAGNALAVLKATANLNARLRLMSFDRHLDAVRFALDHRDALPWLAGFEPVLESLLQKGEATEFNGQRSVDWSVVTGDFPSLIRQGPNWPAPNAILFDPHSKSKNPEMWTLSLFRDLFRFLEPEQPCALATYSRSSLLRMTLLLAGFHVGVGAGTGCQEETTVAANRIGLLKKPLDRQWLQRIEAGSGNAQWLMEGGRMETLRHHPQFV